MTTSCLCNILQSHTIAYAVDLAIDISKIYDYIIE